MFNRIVGLPKKQNNIYSFFQYDHIDETVVTDLQSKLNSTEQINNINGSSESVNQLRPTFIAHRPSQVQTKKSRDSVPFRVRNRNI